MAGHPDRLVADRDPHGGDRRVGIVLLVAKVSAGYRIVLLLFRGHLRDNWLRRPRAASGMAAVWPHRGINRHFDVRAVHRVLFRDGEPHRTKDGQSRNMPDNMRPSFQSL